MIHTAHNKVFVFIRRLLSLFVFSLLFANSFAQPMAYVEETMVQNFYSSNQQRYYWFSSVKNIKKAVEWLTIIEAADNYGLKSNKIQTEKIRTALHNTNLIDTINKEKIDREITSIVLNFIKNLQQGNINFDYDEISVPRDSVYVLQLLNCKPKDHVSKIVTLLDCKDHDYVVLKKYLHDSIPLNDITKSRSIVLAMNYRKFLTLNHFSEYIVVNIPAAEAEYYRNDTLLIKMRTVVGKKINSTPVIASYITNIVTYPHWTVPRTIAVKELLPKVQENGNYLEQNNFEVIDAQGNVIEDSELNWNLYNESNFPFYFRQSTGLNNALGVVKFNLQNPFSIFLHATSQQGAFAKDYRFLSHGCIRLEKPYELVDAILRGQLDINGLKTGNRSTETNTIGLPHKIPTFIIYMPITVDGEKVTFLQDVYGLIK